MRALTDRDDRKINSVNAALGAILAISPLLLGYASAAEATWTAVIGGIVITAVAVAALSHMFEWEEWVNLVAGVCIAASPWLLGFAATTTAVWTLVTIGSLVAVLAAIELWRLHGAPPTEAA
jgi:SPW repeat